MYESIYTTVYEMAFTSLFWNDKFNAEQVFRS